MSSWKSVEEVQNEYIAFITTYPIRCLRSGKIGKGYVVVVDNDWECLDDDDECPRLRLNYGMCYIPRRSWSLKFRTDLAKLGYRMVWPKSSALYGPVEIVPADSLFGNYHDNKRGVTKVDSAAPRRRWPPPGVC